MAELVGALSLPDLTPRAPEDRGGEGGPQAVFACEVRVDRKFLHAWNLVRSYIPSNEGARRLVVSVTTGDWQSLGVWDSSTGKFLRALGGPPFAAVSSLVTYQRSLDERPRAAAAFDTGQLCIWDLDDYQLCHTIRTDQNRGRVELINYEDPVSGRTRLVSG
jgi:WD40 repeat protein